MSTAMDSSNEESDSRTAAFGGRKRKQLSSLSNHHETFDLSDKRVKIDDDSDVENIELRSSKESGEISTGCKASNDSGGVEDLDPARASKFGWAAINGNETNNDPFVNAHQAKSTEATAATARLLMPTTEQHADLVLRKLQRHESIADKDYRAIAAWLRIHDTRLNLQDIQHSGLKAHIRGLLRSNNLDERPGIAQALETLSQGGDYHLKARQFLSERYMSLRPLSQHLDPESFMTGRDEGKSTGKSSIIDDSVPQAIEAKIQTILQALRHSQPVQFEDYEVMAAWLQVHDLGFSENDIGRAGLKKTVSKCMGTGNASRSAGIIAALGTISQGGDFCTQARRLLKERVISVARRPQIQMDTRVRDSLGAAASTSPVLPASGSATHQHTPLTDLIQLEDIVNHSLKSKVEKRSKSKPKESIEETLRRMIVCKEPSFKQAVKFLRQFYEDRNITGERLGIFEVAGEDRLSITQLQKAMDNTTGFLRPMTGRDIDDHVLKSSFLRPVCELLKQCPTLSFAAALLQENGEGTATSIPAGRCLEQFVKINFVGGDGNTSIHSRDGLKALTLSAFANKPSDVMNTIAEKLKSRGAAALSLDELETLLPEPSSDPKENLARKKAKTRQYIDGFWKRPDNSFNCLVAWHLLQLIKGGTALPHARENLDRFVQALQSGGDVDEQVQIEQDPRNGELLHDMPGQGASATTPQHDEQWTAVPQQKDVGTDESNSNENALLLADIERLLLSPSTFTRPMERRDLVQDLVFVNMVYKIQQTLDAPLEEVVLDLAKNYTHADAALRTLNQYIDQCRVAATSAAPSDYGETARRAAAQSDSRTGVHEDNANIRLYQLDDQDQDLQRRYFHISDPESLVRCLSCGNEGHTEESCPSSTCAHCGAFDEHFSSACPANQKCGRCRQPGHTTAACNALSSSLMRGLGYNCDICDRAGHVEEECSELWRNSVGDDAGIVQIPQQTMRVSCYQCGASGYFAHWGDDCPTFSAYDRSVKSLNPTWSKKYADKFIQSTAIEEPHSAAPRESVPSYQLALLGDM